MKKIARNAAFRAGARYFVVASFGCGLALVLTACGGPKKPPGPPAPAVTVTKALQKTVTEWDEYTGRLAAVDEVDVRAQVSGYLESIHFKDGQMVKKGDLLFVIDPRPYQAVSDRAVAQQKQAEAGLSLGDEKGGRVPGSR